MKLSLGSREHSCIVTVILIMLLHQVLPFASVLAQEEVEKPQPRLALFETTYNFGQIAQGEKVVHDFLIKNIGNSDLVINKIVSSCGCAAVSAGSSTIAPGKEEKITVTFDTSGFKGPKSKSVRLYVNDPKTPTVLFTLQGTVVTDVSVEPQSIFFGEIIKGKGASKLAVVRIREGSGMKISDVVTRSPWLEVSMESTSETLNKITVSLKPEVRVGQLRTRVVVVFSGKTRKSINIPVFASVKPAVQIIPASAAFGLIEGTEPEVKVIKLANYGETPVRVLSVNSNHSAVTGSFREVKEGSLYEIEIKVDPAGITGDLRAVVELVTDSPDQKIIQVGVTGIVPPEKPDRLGG